MVKYDYAARCVPRLRAQWRLNSGRVLCRHQNCLSLAALTEMSQSNIGQPKNRVIQSINGANNAPISFSQEAISLGGYSELLQHDERALSPANGRRRDQQTVPAGRAAGGRRGARHVSRVRDMIYKHETTEVTLRAHSPSTNCNSPIVAMRPHAKRSKIALVLITPHGDKEAITHYADGGISI
ncbi:hypothetical protein EVAR_97967_1 [Eumeta japonica]|uniref:Uncharacterized protein n=1 Tax=Eumeta variegata TaxID=151549 RepID=A0A4C1XEL9_EUMVA|nr:hypothetical protein EVAR_97967_1 [Eumeta japonica]